MERFVARLRRANRLTMPKDAVRKLKLKEGDLVVLNADKFSYK